jgi:hypothetical protein
LYAKSLKRTAKGPHPDDAALLPADVQIARLGSDIAIGAFD